MSSRMKPRRASIAPSLQIASISAPTIHRSLWRAARCRRRSSGFPRRWIANICARLDTFGRWCTDTSLSSCPGRRSAISTISARFVPPITTTSFSSSKPSSSVSSWLTTRSVTCESELAPRVGATASSSSNRMMVRETCLARRTSCARLFPTRPPTCSTVRAPLC